MENNNDKPLEQSATPCEEIKFADFKARLLKIKEVQQKFNEFDTYTAIMEEPEESGPKLELKWYQKLWHKLNSVWKYLLQSWIVMQMQKLWQKIKQLVVWVQLKPHQKISDEELTKAIELVQKYITIITPKSKDIYPPYRSGDCLNTEFKGNFRRRGKRFHGGDSFVKPSDELST